MIAIRSSYDHLRKERSIPEIFPPLVGGEDSDESRVPEAVYDFEQALTRREAGELLRCVFTELGPEERMVLSMLYFEDLSVEEVSKRLGWSRANVKIRAYRARQKAQKVAIAFEKEKL